MDPVEIQQQLSPLAADNFEPGSLESLYFSEYGLDLEKQLQMSGTALDMLIAVIIELPVIYI